MMSTQPDTKMPMLRPKDFSLKILSCGNASDLHNFVDLSESKHHYGSSYSPLPCNNPSTNVFSIAQVSQDTRWFFCFQWLVSNLRHAKSITPLETAFVANSRPWYPNWMGIKSKNLYMYFWKASQITTETHQLPICSIIIISLSLSPSIARSWLYIIIYVFWHVLYHIIISKSWNPWYLSCGVSWLTSEVSQSPPQSPTRCAKSHLSRLEEAQIHVLH